MRKAKWAGPRAEQRQTMDVVLRKRRCFSRIFFERMGGAFALYRLLVGIRLGGRDNVFFLFLFFATSYKFCEI